MIINKDKKENTEISNGANRVKKNIKILLLIVSGIILVLLFSKIFEAVYTVFFSWIF